MRFSKHAGNAHPTQVCYGTAMGLGRGSVTPQQSERWVYNRMVDTYAARPAYPAPLITRLAELAGPAPSTIADVGAGIGHLSLPLAGCGHQVYAIEPAEAMLSELTQRAQLAGQVLTPLHAAAEDLPLAAASVDLLVVADALHFMDAHRAGREFGRVLRRGGALAVVLVEFAESPYMQALARLMREAAPRRPKPTEAILTQLGKLCGAPLAAGGRLEQELPVDRLRLEQLLRSISFIGPAMQGPRFEAFCARVHAIEQPALWHTTLRWYVGQRR
jgi:SAM-dependent methyltransferase